MAANWTKIRNDYINGKGSYRELAAKYGVSFNTLKYRGARDGWTQLREEHCAAIATKSRQKTVEKIADAESDVNAIMSRIRLKLTQKIEQAVDNMEDLDTAELRKLVQSFKDMNDASNGTEDKKTGALEDILEAVRGVGND